MLLRFIFFWGGGAYFNVLLKIMNPIFPLVTFFKMITQYTLANWVCFKSVNRALLLVLADNMLSLCH